jgi:hypothetical protein
MAGRRYAVLDANNVVVNHILVADPLPAKYWPGYGKTLVPLEAVDATNPAALDVVILKIADIPQIGDTLDLKTGKITKFVPEIKDEEIEKEDGSKETVQVASAPLVKLATDVDPTPLKAIIRKSEVEVKDGGGK